MLTICLLLQIPFLFLIFKKLNRKQGDSTLILGKTSPRTTHAPPGNIHVIRRHQQPCPELTSINQKKPWDYPDYNSPSNYTSGSQVRKLAAEPQVAHG